jgi:DNA-binding CsgD family transcriptional regulator
LEQAGDLAAFATVVPVITDVLTPGEVAAAAGRLVQASRPELLAALRRELGLALGVPVGPLLAALTPDCPRAPLKVDGPRAATGAELTALAAHTGDAGVWTGEARFAGADRRLLAVAIPTPDGRLASLFAFELPGDESVGEGLAEVARGLCAVVAAAYAGRSGESSPEQLASGMAIARERARTIAELGDTHESALTAILAALRSNQLDDSAARRAATDAAVEALLELRALGDRDRALSEVAASAAFTRLATELHALSRHAGIELELASPDSPRLVPGELANGARAITRGIVLALLDGASRSRIRAGWTVSADALTLSVRDDGDGAATVDALSTHRVAERVAALGGTLRVDVTPGWGTVIGVELPLAPLRGESEPEDPLAVLNGRERDVLDQLAAGRRNREIADELSITVHTVKFHVANILRKLEVTTRGQAAARMGATKAQIST